MDGRQTTLIGMQICSDMEPTIWPPIRKNMQTCSDMQPTIMAHTILLLLHPNEQSMVICSDMQPTLWHAFTSNPVDLF